MTVRGIHHVAISTPDLDRLTEFYVAALGAETVMETSWADNLRVDSMIDLSGSAARQRMVRVGNVHLELFEYTAPTPVPKDPTHPPSDHGYTHLCFDVVDIDAEFDRLVELGMSFSRRAPDGTKLRAIYGRDPDGNIVELQEVLDDTIAFHFSNLEIRIEPDDGGPPA
ncbi:MAG: VOC family protein [Actinomycetota bacterium]